MTDYGSEPAFPTLAKCGPQGMDIRLWLMGQAMVGLLSDEEYIPDDWEQLGQECLKAANSILKAHAEFTKPTTEETNG